MQLSENILKYDHNNYLIVRFLITIKFLLAFISIFLLALEASSQNDSLATVLTLKQIIDSALSNHPEIINAELETVSAKTQVKGALKIQPTEINYERGQRFSSLTDDKLEVQQNFGSPFTWRSEFNYANSFVGLKESKVRLTKAQVINRIKAAYYDCIYEMNRIKLLDSQREIYSELAKKIDTLFKISDSRQLEKITAESKLAELISQSDEAYNDYLISKNSLIREAYLRSDFELSDVELEMYEIEFPVDTSQKIQLNLLSDYYNQHCMLAKASLKLENSKYYPEITAGYFNQSINGSKRFAGFQIGLIAPLWFFTQTSKRDEAIVKKQIAENELNWQKFNTKNASEKLRIVLNKCFEKLNYYYDYALNQADSIENIAIKQFSSSPAVLNECIQSIGIAYSVRLGYLETLNKYNQAAIELELYSSY